MSEFVLAKPIKAKKFELANIDLSPDSKPTGEYFWSFNLGNTEDYIEISDETFKRLFVPLSVREQQIRDIISSKFDFIVDQIIYLKAQDAEQEMKMRTQYKKDKDEAVAAILGIETNTEEK